MQSARLKLSERLDVPVAPSHMWSLIAEPASVVSCMPGASLTGVNDDGSLTGTLVTTLGPTTVTFRGKVRLEFDPEGRAGRLEARGGDERGRTRAAAVVSFRLAPAEPAGTEVSIDAVVDVSGGLAPFVRTGGLHLTRRMLREFSTNLSALAAGDPAPVADQAPAGDRGPDRAPAADATPGGQPKPINAFGLLARTVLDVVRDALGRLVRRGRRAPSSPAEGERRERQ